MPSPRPVLYQLARLGLPANVPHTKERLKAGYFHPPVEESPAQVTVQETESAPALESVAIESKPVDDEQQEPSGSEQPKRRQPKVQKPVTG